MIRTVSAPAALTLALTASHPSGRPPDALARNPFVLLAAMAVLALPLGWARTRPRPVLLVLLAEISVCAAAGLRLEQAWPLLLSAGLVLSHLTATRGRRDGLVAMAVTLLGVEIPWITVLVRERGWERMLVPGFLGLAVLVALSIMAAWLAGTSLRQQREYGEALRAHEAARAVTEERLRIARELHDMVAHSVGVIAIQAGAGHRVLRASPDQAEGALRTIEDTSRQTLRDLRGMLDIMRRADTGHGTGRDDVPRADELAGLDGLDRLAATTRAAGVEVDVRWHGVRGPLPPTVDHAAFRIVQESVTNVVRHAGVGRCRVAIERRPDALALEITDGGRGGGAGDGEGHGIPGMRERVALLGGRFSAGPCPGGGFRVSASLPLPGEAR
ncbi:sensor histidine kinase [Actinomadura harenae]|uniref:histidine kinase n=1 Tax=Actinomadura harenae TaxID=2483351 RepID=A0A3M2LSP0_9ACTN|nr:sensor histidine kinase [Actinomadura harenae]